MDGKENFFIVGSDFCDNQAWKNSYIIFAFAKQMKLSDQFSRIKIITEKLFD